MAKLGTIGLLVTLAIAIGLSLQAGDHGRNVLADVPDPAAAEVPARRFAKARGTDENVERYYERAADAILKRAQPPAQGYCLVYGGGRGQLAYELAQRSDLKFLSVDPNEGNIDAGRTMLADTGLYGNRITLQAAPLESLPYRDYAAVLVLCDSVIESGSLPGDPTEMFRMCRPHGGKIVIGQPAGCPHPLARVELEAWIDEIGLAYEIHEGHDGLWAVMTRASLPGAGEWTHLWADAANTGCSQDARMSENFEVLWFGEPGPRIMVDRHWRPMAPLYKNGRFVVPGNNRIVCLDAYNGARYWDLPLPRSARIAIMRDCGWLVLTDDYLYAVVDNQCHLIDPATGEIATSWTLSETDMDWGYVAYEDGRIFGSFQDKGASRLAVDYYSRGAVGNQISRKDNQPVVVSRGVFCCDAQDGCRLWTYRPQEAVVVNPALCVGVDGVYFWESTNPEAVHQRDSRVAPSILFEAGYGYLVKLDSYTGDLCWRAQIDLPVEHIVNLSYSQGKLVSSGCMTRDRKYWYHLCVCDARDGNTVWQKEFSSGFANTDTDHGKQDKRPMIMDDMICFKYGSFDLHDGTSLEYRFSTSNCADCSASATHLFGRNGGVATMYEFGESNEAGQPLCSQMRPGCYISIIPAGGVIMLPSYSAGCTCGYTLQTTIGWLPKRSRVLR